MSADDQTGAEIVQQHEETLKAIEKVNKTLDQAVKPLKQNDAEDLKRAIDNVAKDIANDTNEAAAAATKKVVASKATATSNDLGATVDSGEGNLIKSIFNIDLSDADKFISSSTAGSVAITGILSKIASKFYTRGIKGGTFAKQFYAAAQPEKVLASMAVAIFATGTSFDNYYGSNRPQAVGKAVADFKSGVNPSLIKFKFEPVQEDESLGLDTINQASQLQSAEQQTSEQFVYRTSISNFLFEDIVTKRSDINENVNRNSYQKEINDHNSLTKEFKNFFK